MLASNSVDQVTATTPRPRSAVQMAETVPKVKTASAPSSAVQPANSRAAIPAATIRRRRSVVYLGHTLGPARCRSNAVATITATIPRPTNAAAVKDLVCSKTAVVRTSAADRLGIAGTMGSAKQTLAPRRRLPGPPRTTPLRRPSPRLSKPRNRNRRRSSFVRH